MRAEYIDRIVYPKHRCGADFGAEAVVLVRILKDGKSVKELWWERAGKYWADRMRGYVSSSASLCLVTPYTHPWSKPYINGDGSRKTLHEGGRFSQALVARFAKEIDEFFGQEVANLIDPKKTLVLFHEPKRRGPRNLLKGAPVTVHFESK